ncbi:MAG: alpha/beta hydrolase [Gemmatimonadaceae bacterium]
MRLRSALSLLCLLLPAAAASQAPRRGTVRVESFDSPALGARKHYVVYLPPSYASARARRYPVAYYLHGADGNEADWVSRAALDRVMDSLVARGAPEMIVVMPDGDESWYATPPRPPDHDECARGRFGEDPTLRCVARADYDAYLSRDLVRHVDSTYRTRADRAHRAIGGLSMGGYGALRAALTHPETWSAAVSHSGVVSLLFAGPRPFVAPASYAASLETLRAAFGDRYWGELRGALGDDVAAWRAADPAELARRLRDAGRPLPAIYLDAGSDDALVIDRNRAFDAELTALGVAHEYHEWPGRHEWRYWHAHVREGLVWLGKRISD